MVYDTGETAIFGTRDMAKHSHGSMDIRDQEKTFNAFVTWVTRSVIAIVVALVLLALING